MRKIRNKEKNTGKSRSMKVDKNIVEEYLKKPYKIQIEYHEEDGVFFAEVVELPGCITYAENLDDAYRMIKDAMRAWITVALEKGKEIPEPMSASKYSGKFLVRVSRSLHEKLVKEAQKEGVSLNHLVAELLATGLTMRSILGKEVDDKAFVLSIRDRKELHYKTTFNPDIRGYTGIKKRRGLAS